MIIKLLLFNWISSKINVFLLETINKKMYLDQTSKNMSLLHVSQPWAVLV